MIYVLIVYMMAANGQPAYQYNAMAYPTREACEGAIASVKARNIEKIECDPVIYGAPR